MSITINLPPATLEELKAVAKASGKDVETVVREAVDAKLARRKQTFTEILKPIHDAVETCGMSQEEVDQLAEQAVADARAARRTSRHAP